MIMKKVLITGSNGQLGNEIRIASAQFADMQFVFTDVAELDICDEVAVDAMFACEKFDFVVNCAAYTAVDKAEDDADNCFKINEKAVEILGKASAKYHSGIIHVSTDYVFDGTSFKPYTEDMHVCPVSVYGKSKLAGEIALQNVNPQAIIVRTSWLYSSFGNNFVKTMLNLGKSRDTLTVIFDQVGTPTYAADLAVALLKMVDSDVNAPGIYHFSNEGVCSWYDFTISIHKMGGIKCKVYPIESKDYPVRTPRPHYSVLNKSKIKTTFGLEIPHWETSLEKCIALLEAK
jgi:dTDP-4-dehydrorhamnose reductase